MRLRSLTALMVTMASPCWAEVDGIQNHQVQRMFMEEPCSVVIDTIDHAKPTPEGTGMLTMAFGFLMGFEAAHPNIRGNQETILIRLRADCAEQPKAKAFDLLQGYVTN